MRLRQSALVIALAAAPFATASAQAAQSGAPAARPRPAQLPADSLERARKYTLWLYTNQSDSLFTALDSASRADAGSAKGVENWVAGLATFAGSEESLVSERWVTRNGRRQYWRTAKFTGYPEPVQVRWVFTSKGEIGGLGMNPASSAPPIDPP
jgi:hypothetical protein